MVNFSPSELWMENFNSITWISSSMELWEQTPMLFSMELWSYLDTSRFKPWRFIAWVSPSDVVLWYCAFLLKSLKLGGIASPHSPCIIPCASRLHHNISINTQVYLSLEQECRYPIPLECILDNLTTVTYFRCSLLEDYTFEAWIALV
jgi:hypothetical protein